MFVKKSWCTIKGKRYYTYQIAESYRPGKGKNPQTRIIANISHLPKPIIDKIAILLKYPNSTIIPDLNSFFKESYSFGCIFFLYLFMKNAGITDCLKVIPKKSRDLLIAVIMNRIIEPRSKLGSVSWVKKTAFPLLFNIEREKLNVNSIYRAMDILYKKIGKVLDEFYKRNKKDTILLLYDITSVFFEGNGPEELAFNGFSRDGKPENKQIILSLVLNEEKLPVYFDILPGNTTDKKTVIPLIKKLKEKYNLNKSIFIGDRGMITMENIEFLEKEGIDYIIALTHKKARELIFNKKIQPELFDKKIPTTIYEEEDETGRKRRYILCGSEYRKDHDIKTLEHLLEKGKKSLERVANMVRNGRLKDSIKVIRRAQKKLTEGGVENFYDFKYENGNFEIIENKELIEKAKALCGYYILQTTVTDMEEKEIEQHYKSLKFVEDAFRQLKQLIEIRPIFHWKERRVRTHIFLCIIAQTIVNKIIDVLTVNGWLGEENENTFSYFLDTLYQINVGIFEIENLTYEIITQLKEKQKEFLKLFRINEKLFSNFIEAKKIVD